jgi:hypothetical protein
VREVTDADGEEVDWEPEGGTVLTVDSYASVLLRFTSKETDPALYSPAFGAAFALRLAAGMCVTLTDDEDRAKDLELLYRAKLKEAGARVGKQGRADQRPSSSWLRTARGG